jgi:hypothetical protein
MRDGTRASLLLLSLLLAACDGAEGSHCVTGASAACACTDGRTGAQVCQPDGTFAACVCADGPPPDAAPEPPPDAAPDAAACPGASQEFCDGVDNDCNGSVDEGEVCPDAAVLGATPFTGGVYLEGTTAEGSCNATALQRFWPAQATSYASGFDCYSRWYRFRRSDGAIYYHATFSGIRRDVASGADPVVPTPPCQDQVGVYFDFDGAGALHYQCADTVRRGDGVLVASSVLALAATLDDGRLVVTRGSPQGTVFAVLGASGNEVSRLSPFAAFAGTMTAAPGLTTASGNRAYVAYQREYAGGTKKEIVVFRVDESSAWSKVRRAEVPAFGLTQLVLPDGTVFVRERDPASANFEERIVAFPPSGGSQVVWREAEQTVVRAHIGSGMFAGPP